MNNINFVAKEVVDNCPLCQGIRHNLLKKNKIGRYLRCKICGVSFLSLASAEFDKGLPGQSSTITDHGYSIGLMQDWGDRVEMARRILKRRIPIYEKILGRPVRKVLEIGCGTGGWGPAFTDSNIEYSGIDINPDMVYFCRGKNLNVRCLDVADMNEDMQYDIIICSQVLEHSRNPCEFVLKANKLLVMGGLIHLDVPNDNGVIPSVKKLFSKWSNNHGFIQPPHHCVAYSRASMGWMFTRAGSWGNFRSFSVGPFHPIYGVIHPRSRYGLLQRLCLGVSNYIGGSYLVVLAVKVEGCR